MEHEEYDRLAETLYRRIEEAQAAATAEIEKQRTASSASELQAHARRLEHELGRADGLNDALNALRDQQFGR